MTLFPGSPPKLIERVGGDAGNKPRDTHVHVHEGYMYPYMYIIAYLFIGTETTDNSELHVLSCEKKKISHILPTR